MDECFHCSARILDKFSDELTTDLFILSAHFNNLLNNGVVTVNVDDQYVEYYQKRDSLVPLLYKGELLTQINRHYVTAIDIYLAFQWLVDEGEAPAIIIADLMRNKDKAEEEEEEQHHKP